MTSASPLDLHALVGTVLPALPAGPARSALLVHLAAAVAAWPPGAPPARLPDLDEQLRTLDRSAPDSGKEKAQVQALHDAVLARWSPWDPAHAWGWDLLTRALQRPDAKAVRRLLAAPGAPDGATLSAHPLTAAIEGTSRKATGVTTATALGLALVAGDTLARAAVVQALLEHGANPNAPTTDGGPVPMGLVRGPHALAVLAAADARMTSDAASVLGWLPTRAAGLPQIQERLATWSAALAEGHPSLSAALQQHWPALVEGVGRVLAVALNDRDAERMGVARQLRALGRTWGQDCWRPAAGEPSLAGEWARASATGAVRPDPNQPPMKALKALSERAAPYDAFADGRVGLWGGQTTDGVPAGAWGLLLSLQRQPRPADEKRPPSFFPDGGEWAYDAVGAALDRVPVGPFLWRAVLELGTLLKRPEDRVRWRPWATRALARTAGPEGLAFLQGLSGAQKETFEELGRLPTMVAHDWRTHPPASTPEGLQDALTLFVWDGWRRPGAAALWSMAQAEGWPLDREKALAETQHPWAARNAGERPEWAALGLELTLPPGAPARPGPRM